MLETGVRCPGQLIPKTPAYHSALVERGRKLDTHDYQLATSSLAFAVPAHWCDQKSKEIGRDTSLFTKNGEETVLGPFLIVDICGLVGVIAMANSFRF